MSRIRTLAPRPAATLAALEPTTPPPRIATSAGATPGTPDSKIPRPSWGRSRYLAPSWMLIRPATSLIGVSSGRPPRVIAKGLVGDGRDAAVDEGAGQRLIGGEVEIGEHHLAGPQQRPLGRLRLLDLDDQLGLGPDLGGLGHDRRAGRLVLSVGDPTALPRPGLDQDRVARVAQLLDADREHRHSVLVRLDLLGHSDDHSHDSTVRPLERCRSAQPALASRFPPLPFDQTPCRESRRAR